jgi:hypothetical protein
VISNPLEGQISAKMIAEKGKLFSQHSPAIFLEKLGNSLP